MHAPMRIASTDYLVIESTYGDRSHEPEDPRIKLATVINRTVARKGAVIIPAFAVGRTQSLLHYIHQLKATGKIRMFADGSADYNKKLGLDADFSAFGMGMRSKRYSMLIEDGVVKKLNVEEGGKLEVSSAEAMLAQL